MQISVIGDSFTKGVVLSDGKYHELDLSFVNILAQESDMPIYNYSKFGSTLRYGHSVLARHQSEISGSEYTIIEFGGNDSDFIWDVVASEPIMLSLAPIIGKRYFSFVTRRMTDALEEKNSTIAKMGYIPMPKDTGS